MSNMNFSGCIIFCGKRILLQKKTLDHPAKCARGKWCLFGGGVMEDERPREGLIREIKEETGLKLNPKFLCVNYHYKKDGELCAIESIYTANIKDISKINLKEGAGFALFELEEINKLNILKQHLEAIKKCNLKLTKSN